MPYRDFGSSFDFLDATDGDVSHAVGAHEGATIDCVNAGGVSFAVQVTSVGTGGTLAVKVQTSDDGTTWADLDTVTALALDATGLSSLHVPEPRARYVRAHLTAATDTVAASVIAARGPKTFVEPS